MSSSLVIKTTTLDPTTASKGYRTMWLVRTTMLMEGSIMSMALGIMLQVISIQF